MEQRLSIITLGVTDLVRAKRFYDSLGWKAANEGTEEIERIVAYNLIGFCLALYPKDDLAADATVALAAEGHPPITLAYTVETPAEVDKVLKTAEAAGGSLIKPGQKAFWGGYSGYFADPDGTLWEVAHNPFASRGEDGAFRW